MSSTTTPSVLLSQAAVLLSPPSDSSDQDALVQDFDMPLDSNISELPLYSGGVVKSFCNMKQKLSTGKKHKQLDERTSSSSG
ncbi:hypothetical protein RJ641_009591 [Dillenia turbinata]|uniref:Uncharacterized protein n=1 Tax=Dillenia turbinata TaxID=194707 RepID=A0AAN8V0M1_9MAGN